MDFQEFPIKTTYISDLTIDKTNNKIIGKPIYKCRNLISVDNKIEEIDFENSTDFHHSLSNDRYYNEGFSDKDYPVNIKHYIIESKTNPNVIHIIEEIDIIFDSDNDEDYWDEGDFYVPTSLPEIFDGSKDELLDNDSNRKTIENYILDLIKNDSSENGSLKFLKDKDKVVGVILENYEREYNDKDEEIIYFYFSVIRNTSCRKDGNYNIQLNMDQIKEIIK
jgi:hypothetical protein